MNWIKVITKNKFTQWISWNSTPNNFVDKKAKDKEWMELEKEILGSPNNTIIWLKLVAYDLDSKGILSARE